MLQEIEDDPAHTKNTKFGLCYLIMQLFFNEKFIFINEEYLKPFPEILISKPLKPYDDFYWFSIDDWEPRTEIIKEAIKATR